jgi:hypothetical protein
MTCARGMAKLPLAWCDSFSLTSCLFGWLLQPSSITKQPCCSAGSFGLFIVIVKKSCYQLQIYIHHRNENEDQKLTGNNAGFLVLTGTAEPTPVLHCPKWFIQVNEGRCSMAYDAMIVILTEPWKLTRETQA